MELQNQENYVYDIKLCSNEEIEKIPQNVHSLMLRWCAKLDKKENDNTFEKECVTDWSFLEKFTELVSLYIYIDGDNASFLSAIENKVVNLPISLKDLVIFNETINCVKDLSFLERLVNLDTLYLNKSIEKFCSKTDFKDISESPIFEYYLRVKKSINIVKEWLEKLNNKNC